MSSRSSKTSKTNGTGGLTFRQSQKKIESLIRGNVFTPGFRPPNVVAQPWNNLTVIDVRNTKTKRLSVGDLGTLICNQSGLYTDDESKYIDVEFKIQSVSMWAEDAHLSLYPFDFWSGGLRELTRIDGTWAKNQWARVGFAWPANLQNAVLANAEADKMQKTPIYEYQASKATTIHTHIRVVWRSSHSKSPQLQWVQLPTPKPCNSEDAGDNISISSWADPADLLAEIAELKTKVLKLQNQEKAQPPDGDCQ